MLSIELAAVMVNVDGEVSLVVHSIDFVRLLIPAISGCFQLLRETDSPGR